MKYELKQIIKEPPVTVSLTPKIIFVACNPVKKEQLCFLIETFQPITNKKINALCWYNYDKEKNSWKIGGVIPYNDNVRSSISFSPNGSHFLMNFNNDNFRPPFFVFDIKLKMISPSDDKVSEGLCGAYFTEDGSVISAWNDKDKKAVIRIYSIADDKLVKSSEYQFGDEKIFGFRKYDEDLKVKDKKLLGFFSSPDRKVVAVIRNETSGYNDQINRSVNIWSPATPIKIVSLTVKEMNEKTKCLEFNPANNKMFAIGLEGYISIYDTTSLREKERNGERRPITLYHTVDKTDNLVYSIAWSPDGKTIAFCNKIPIVCMYHLKDSFWVKDEPIEITSEIKQICFDLNGNLIVATDTNILIGAISQDFPQPSPICDMIKQVYKNESFEKMKALCEIMLSNPLDVTLAALEKTQKKGGLRKKKKTTIKKRIFKT